MDTFRTDESVIEILQNVLLDDGDYSINLQDSSTSVVDIGEQHLHQTSVYTTLVPVDMQISWVDSSPTTSSYEVTESLYSPMPSSEIEENITMSVSPVEVFAELAPPKKKRGRKPKALTGVHSTPKPKEPRKRKAYENDVPFKDKVKERQRKCAINAKNHRDKMKQALELLSEQLESVKADRDSLKREVEALRLKETELSQQLEVFKNYLRSQAASIVTLLSTGRVSL